MKISIIRGAFLNPFELQNYYPLKNQFEIQAISSLHPTNPNIELPLIKLPSPTDLPNFPFKFPLLNRIFVDAHQLFGLQKMIRGSDIAHVAETYYGYTYQSLLAKKNRSIKKVVSTVWEIIPHNNERIRGRKSYKNLAREEVDVFIAATHLAKAALVEEGVNPNKIQVIYMGVDLSRFCPTVKADKKNLNILFVGRLVAEKGISELLSSFSNLQETHRNITLTLVGSGQIKAAVRPGISIREVAYGEIQKVYQQADIFCLPSKPSRFWQEQYGMVLVEAMASGLPIVTTRTGAIPEVVGDSAVLVRPGSVNELTTAIKNLISQPNLRKQLARNSLKRARLYFDYQVAAQKIATVYSNLCPIEKSF